MVYRVTCVRSICDNVGMFRRAGIIPYIKIGGIPHYFFMVDSKYGQLTDPGGRVNSEELWIDAAIREMAEETRGIFDYREQREDVIDSGIAVWSAEKGTILVFLKIHNEDPYGLCTRYRVDFVEGVKRGESRQRLENSMMMCISHSDLQALASFPNRPGEEDFERIYDESLQPMPLIMSLLVSMSHGRPIQTYPHIYAPVRSAVRKCHQKMLLVL